MYYWFQNKRPAELAGTAVKGNIPPWEKFVDWCRWVPRWVAFISTIFHNFFKSLYSLKLLCRPTQWDAYFGDNSTSI